jgi:hypothetical protein
VLATCTTHLTLLHVKILITCDEGFKPWLYSFCTFLCHSPLVLSILLGNCLQIPSVFFLPSGWGLTFTRAKTICRIIVLCF